MSRPKLEVADVFRRHGAAWRAANKAHLSLAQRRVMTAIEVCRTAALGGHVERCEDCGHTRIAYNSCRNRHCPKCQWPAAQAWMAAREAELLPVPYFHVVFTLPAALGAIASRNGFFLPVRVLSRLFRRLFLQGLEAMHAADELQFFADLSKLKHANAWRAYLPPLRKSEWVVYATKPFAGPLQVLAYLARYTHRVAISNSRLLDLDATHVSFRWKDYRENGHRSKVMRLDVGEFMRRFLLHVLPTGFHRIRHYGLFANGHRADNLELCRRALNVPSPPTAHANSDNTGATSSDHEPPPCPCCGGRMIVIETFDGPLSPPYHLRKLDGL